ncbi:MAG: hypothetical protein RSP_11710 [Rhodanobacter sp.]
MKMRTATSRLIPRSAWLARSAAVLLAASIAVAIPGRAQAGVYVSVNFAPPPLPVYVQPPIPGPGYIWTPGYWAWDGYQYYWVPGAWLLAPYVGALWTPGYWGWSGGVYIFHAGYWGRHVGFYGGVNYGYGYGGHGYDGGYWRNGGFYYNRSVNHVTNRITNVYNRTVVNTTINRTSFSGGPGGIHARAMPQEAGWNHEPHAAPMAVRGAHYAPRGNPAMPAERYQPAPSSYRETRYQPQRYQAPAYRPQEYAQPAYRQGNAHPQQYAHPAPHGGNGQGPREWRHDDHH